MELISQTWKLQTVLVLVLVTLKTVLCIKKTEVVSQLHELDRFIKYTMNCRNIPALAISVVMDNKVLFSRGYGHADIENGIKAKEHTKFCIGSLTKAFTATVIAEILSNHQNLTWDTPICEILGASFQLSDKLRTKNVNLRDLLAHKVGTPSNFHALLVGFPANFTRSELVERLHYMPAVSEFRTKFYYNNYMYMLAGYVAEMITGESWENLIKTRLIDKIGMRDTGFVDQIQGLDDIAVPYVLKNKKLTPIDKELVLTVSPSGPAGSIYSTASDMSKWIMFHLHNGHSVHGYTIVNDTWLNETYASQMTHPFAEKDLVKPIYPITDVSISYNMGWMSSVYRGYRKLWHSGGIVTFTSQLWMFPDVNAGVFVTASGPLSFQGSLAVKTITARSSDMLLGLKPWLNTSTTCTYPAPWGAPKTVTLANNDIVYIWNITKPMNAYEGFFGNSAFGNISILVQNESLILVFGRFGKLRLQPRSESVFLGFYLDRLWFVSNSDNNVNPVQMKFVKDSTSGIITGLLFPIDFTHKKTLFEKGLNLKPSLDASLANTSFMCNSGKMAATNSLAMDTYHNNRADLLLICILYCLWDHFGRVLLAF